MSLRTYLVVMAAAALLAACGDDPADDVGTPAPAATTTATATPTSTPEPTDTAQPATPDDTATAAPSEEESPGDEDGNRVDIRFDLHGDEIAPARIEVPAFLGLRVRVRNRSEETRRLTLDGASLTVLGAGAEEHVLAEGLRPGEHTLDAGAGGRATIVAVRAGG